MPQFLFIVAAHFKGGIFCCFSENIKMQHLPVQNKNAFVANAAITDRKL
jgi:hypothetical protein